VGSDSIIQKLGLLRRKCFSTKWERDRIVERINEYKPDFILANSSELLYIAQYILNNGIEIYKPRYFCPTGENIDGRTEKILKSVYGEGLINIYGGTEMADFAVRKPGETHYEIIESLASVCIMDDKGKNRRFGNGSLLVTPLFRKRYPLINYEIGDIVELKEIDGEDRIINIRGRKNDVFYWKNGSSTIYKRLEDVNMGLEYIFQIRFIQDSDSSVIIQVVKDSSATKTKRELEQYLDRMYADVFGKDITIKYEWMDVIPPDPNGKIRNMISFL